MKDIFRSQIGPEKELLFNLKGSFMKNIAFIFIVLLLCSCQSMNKEWQDILITPQIGSIKDAFDSDEANPDECKMYPIDDGKYYQDRWYKKCKDFPGRANTPYEKNAAFESERKNAAINIWNVERDIRSFISKNSNYTCDVYEIKQDIQGIYSVEDNLCTEGQLIMSDDTKKQLNVLEKKRDSMVAEYEKKYGKYTQSWSRPE
jgi:hypothetical protein